MAYATLCCVCVVCVVYFGVRKGWNEAGGQQQNFHVPASDKLDQNSHAGKYANPIAYPHNNDRCTSLVLGGFASRRPVSSKSLLAQSLHAPLLIT